MVDFSTFYFNAGTGEFFEINLYSVSAYTVPVESMVLPSVGIQSWEIANMCAPRKSQKHIAYPFFFLNKGDAEQ